MGVDFTYASGVLGLLIMVMLCGALVLKKYQKKLHSQGQLSLEEGVLVDTKRRVMIVKAENERFLYVVGPHNDMIIPLHGEKKLPNKEAQDQENFLTSHGLSQNFGNECKQLQQTIKKEEPPLEIKPTLVTSPTPFHFEKMRG